MPERLTFQATLVLVAIALGLAFGVVVLVSGGASPAKPSAMRGSSPDQSARGSAIDLGLTAARAVPALRVPRKESLQPQAPARIGSRSVTPALTLVARPVAPVQSARPAPTAVPRVLPAPNPNPKPKPQPEPKLKPAPAPVSPPGSSGDFDTTGEPLTEVTPKTPGTTRAPGSDAK